MALQGNYTDNRTDCVYENVYCRITIEDTNGKDASGKFQACWVAHLYKDQPDAHLAPRSSPHRPLLLPLLAAVL